MTARRLWPTKRVFLAWFVLHFLLVVTLGCYETVWLVARGLTILPTTCRDYSRKVEGVGVAMVGLGSANSHPLREALATYLSFAGIDAGYGYFAPNVPNGYRLVFEFHYPDGHTETQVPNGNGRAAALRLASLLDQIGTQSDAFREYAIKKLAAVTWREHPRALSMRALFGQLTQPTPTQYEHGQRETYTLLYAYDFSLSSDVTPKPGS